MTSGFRTRGGASITMQRILIMAALATSACTPLSKNAGELDSNTDSATMGGDDATEDAESDTASTTSTPGDDAMVEFVPFDGTLGMPLMTRFSGGVVVATSSNPPNPTATLHAYSPDLDLLWTMEFPETFIIDISPVGDGLIVASQSALDGNLVATAWRLSCCGEIERTLVLPPEAPSLSNGFGAGVAQGDGILLSRSGGSLDSQLIHTNLDLEPEWTVDVAFDVVSAARSTADNVVLDASEGGDAWLTYEVLADGTGTGQGFGERLQVIGSEENLGLLGQLGPDTLTIRPYVGLDGGGGPVSTVQTGPLSTNRVVWDGRDRFAVAVEDQTIDANDIEPVTVFEFNDAGEVLRTVSVAPPTQEKFEPMALAVGNDNAIYFAAVEIDDDPETEHESYIVRIDPL